MSETERKQIVLGITRNHSGDVLIIERVKKEEGKEKARLSWAFPGGGKEEGESNADTAKRETLEETGYDVEPEQVISEKDHPQFPVHVVYMVCSLNPVPQQQVTDSEIKQSKWVQPLELSKYFTSNLDQRVAVYLGLTK